MSWCRGFSIVEMMVVLVVFGFMIAMGTPAFNTWQKKHNAEDEIEKLYGSLQYARMKAYAEKVTWGVYWGTGSSTFSSYQIRRDNTTPPNGSIGDDEDASPDTATALKSPITSGGVGGITFDARGFCNVSTTLRVSASTGASTDCVKSSFTRIRVGKWDGSECNPK